MKNEETPQHSSIKKRAVASPSVPIQFFARSPSIHVESSVAVKRCDVMLNRIKQLMTKITAPIQNRVISALDMPSSDAVLASSPLMSFQNFFVLSRRPFEESWAFLLLTFFVVFLSVLLCTIRVKWILLCKFKGKKRKRGVFEVFFINFVLE